MIIINKNWYPNDKEYEYPPINDWQWQSPLHQHPENISNCKQKLLYILKKPYFQRFYKGIIKKIQSREDIRDEKVATLGLMDNIIKTVFDLIKGKIMTQKVVVS